MNPSQHGAHTKWIGNDKSAIENHSFTVNGQLGRLSSRGSFGLRRLHFQIRAAVDLSSKLIPIERDLVGFKPMESRPATLCLGKHSRTHVAKLNRRAVLYLQLCLWQAVKGIRRDYQDRAPALLLMPFAGIKSHQPDFTTRIRSALHPQACYRAIPALASIISVTATRILVVVSFVRFSRARPQVIPAKAGIQYVRCAVPKVCGVDSRLRGNDLWSRDARRPYCSNDTTTRIFSN